VPSYSEVGDSKKWMESIDSRYHYSLGINRESHWEGMLGFEGRYDVAFIPNLLLAFTKAWPLKMLIGTKPMKYLPDLG